MGRSYVLRLDDDKAIRLLDMLKSGCSGQRLAELLGVSRTSVWKFVKKLEEMGYVIEAKRRVGYRIVKSPDLSVYEVARVCWEFRRWIREVRYYKVVDSTNERAKEDGRRGVLYIAERQTRGRGRFGRNWISEPGGLYFTLTVPDPFPIDDVTKLTLTAGVAVAEAIGGRLKWVNDVMIDGKKVCGILCELSGEVEDPVVIVGIGVNVNNEVPENATSLKAVKGRELNRAEVLKGILERFFKYYDTLKGGGWGEIREKWRMLSETIGKIVRVRTAGGVVEGRALDIDEDGALLVDSNGSVVRVTAGECIHVE